MVVRKGVDDPGHPGRVRRQAGGHSVDPDVGRDELAQPVEVVRIADPEVRGIAIRELLVRRRVGHDVILPAAGPVGEPGGDHGTPAIWSYADRNPPVHRDPKDGP